MNKQSILCVGVATLDIINTVESYPHEDEKVRALSQLRQRGGNAANTACVLGQHGHDVALLATLGDDEASEEILADLHYFAIDTRYCPRMTARSSPVSYVTLNNRNGSRTIVHYRQLEELQLGDFQAIKQPFDWYHFEGRNIEQTQSMMQSLRDTRDGHADRPYKISLEIEKSREDIECLFDLADVLIFSRSYIEDMGYSDARSFIADTREIHKAMVVCTWGEAGVYGQSGLRPVYHTASIAPAVTSSLGAGDTFNAGLIDGLLRNYKLESAMDYATRLAIKKLSQSGFAALVGSA